MVRLRRVFYKVLYTSATELSKGVVAYISPYNRVIKHSGLGREVPVSSLCKRFKSDPELFKRDFIVIDGERMRQKKIWKRHRV